jgi:hypothetical protein
VSVVKSALSSICGVCMYVNKSQGLCEISPLVVGLLWWLCIGVLSVAYEGNITVEVAA